MENFLHCTLYSNFWQYVFPMLTRMTHESFFTSSYSQSLEKKTKPVLCVNNQFESDFLLMHYFVGIELIDDWIHTSLNYWFDPMRKVHESLCFIDWSQFIKIKPDCWIVFTIDKRSANDFPDDRINFYDNISFKLYRTHASDYICILTWLWPITVCLSFSSTTLVVFMSVIS